MSTDARMLDRKEWAEFRDAGLLWWINRMLHLFGWAIVYEFNNEGAVTEAYPARCKFRGFEPPAEEEGFKALSGYLKHNADQLVEDCEA